MSVSFTVFDLFLLGIALVALRQWARRASLPLPPGPKGWPLIGNMLNMPNDNFLKTYNEWGQKYGNIVYISVAGQPLIVLGDVEVANEMLDKKSAIYSDRPVMEMAGELGGFNKWTGFLAYGPRWKETRKYMHHAIGTRESLADFGSLFESETRKFLKAVLRDPENAQRHVRFSAGAIIVLIAYGYQAQNKEDSMISLAESAMIKFKLLRNPGAYLVDFIPLLKYVPPWFPGASFKQVASDVRNLLEETAETPFQFSVKEMAKGTAQASLVSKNMEDASMTDAEKDCLKWAASSLFSGGADTSVGALSTFYLAMSRFPDVQRQAQEEIDRVIGGGRLPTLADRGRLPYVSALLNEVYRWRPVVTLGFSHRSTEADTHRGYYIPKGSIVIPNMWRMLHDPQIYPHPEVFSPERFLERDGKPAQRNPRVCNFGFGRRICPGMQFTDITVWLAIAMTLSVLEVSEADEESEKASVFVGHPQRFKCKITPRSKSAEELILQSS